MVTIIRISKYLRIARGCGSFLSAKLENLIGLFDFSITNLSVVKVGGVPIYPGGIVCKAERFTFDFIQNTERM